MDSRVLEGGISMLGCDTVPFPTLAGRTEPSVEDPCSFAWASWTGELAGWRR